MKKVLFCSLLIGLTIAAKAQYNNPKLDSLLTFYEKTFDFNGMAFVVSGDRILLNKAYGFKDKDKNLINDNHGIYMIGSVTKPFTSQIILLLASQKKLNLQDRLSKYFPDYFVGNKITIEHLLTHTSGIYNYTDDTMWNNHPASPVSQQQVLQLLKSKPLAFDPGSKYRYSNSNYMLLSYIIEQVTHQSYFSVVRKMIITPLGMKNTGFDFAHLQDDRKVTGYNGIHNDSFYRARALDSTQTLGAGALYSTAEDLYKWYKALRSYKIVPKEWQDKAYEVYKSDYGYGWNISNEVESKHTIAHSGGVYGFSAYFMMLDKEDVCIILLKNVQYMGANNSDIAKKIVKILYDRTYKIPSPRPVLALPKETLQKYTGTYLFDSTRKISFKIKGTDFYTSLGNSGDDKLVAESESRFFNKLVDVQFEFVGDDKGYNSVMLYQNGIKYVEAKRILE